MIDALDVQGPFRVVDNKFCKESGIANFEKTSIQRGQMLVVRCIRHPAVESGKVVGMPGQSKSFMGDAGQIPSFADKKIVAYFRVPVLFDVKSGGGCLFNIVPVPLEVDEILGVQVVNVLQLSLVSSIQILIEGLDMAGRRGKGTSFLFPENANLVKSIFFV